MADIVNIYWVRYLTSTTDENIESNENELKAIREVADDAVEAMRRLWNNSSWILHPDNAPAYTLMLVRKFLDKNKTVIMLQPLLSSVPKTEDIDKRKTFCYNWGGKRKSETGAVGHTKKRVPEVFWGLEKTLA